MRFSSISGLSGQLTRGASLWHHYELPVLDLNILQPIQRGGRPRIAVDAFSQILLSNLFHIDFWNRPAFHHETHGVESNPPIVQGDTESSSAIEVSTLKKLQSDRLHRDAQLTLHLIARKSDVQFAL